MNDVVKLKRRLNHKTSIRHVITYLRKLITEGRFLTRRT